MIGFRAGTVDSETAIAPTEVIHAHELNADASRSNSVYDYLILGAGASGLSLASRLLDAGLKGNIALIDRRSGYQDDRTWCYWDVEPTPFDDLASHAWSQWSVVDQEGRAHHRGPCSHRYLRLRSIDVYRRLVQRLGADERIDFYLGESIQTRSIKTDLVEVETEGRILRGRHAFDSARGPAQARVTGPANQPALVQHFLGQTVRTAAPTFDTSRPIIMDFRVSQRDGPHFVYLLPLAPRIALVENTYLFPTPVSEARHREEIARYLKHTFGARTYDVLGEERGRIPMSVGPLGFDASPRRTPIGLAGAAARPSSGYAFLRIQRQTRLLADAVVQGADRTSGAVTRLAPGKYDFFDTVFLQALADHPHLAADIFTRMFQRVDEDSLIRFMGDQSSLVDDLRLIAALPKWPFIRAALRSYPTWSKLCFQRS